MDLAFGQQDRIFRAEVRNFIDRHWPESARAAAASWRSDREPAAVRGWFDALVSRSWSVPDWPVEHGGTGWTPTQQLIWDQETALAEVPALPGCGPALVGPLLCRWGNPAQQARFLPPIRALRQRWCQARPEQMIGGMAAVPAISAQRGAAQYLVNGEVVTQSGPAMADWMLCPVVVGCAGNAAPGHSLLLIDMRSPGITVDSRAAEAGSTECVALRNVAVPAANLVGREHSGAVYLAELAGQQAVLPGVATARVQYERLGRLAAEMPSGAGSVADDAAFQRQYRDLGVDLLGLEMLQLRIVSYAARGDSHPGVAALRPVAELQRARFDQRVAELMLETLGYYALPCPDELLIDNEGPIGHDYALPAQQQWRVSHLGASTEQRKDTIARLALDL